MTRIGPVQNQLVRYRFLEWTGIYGDVIEVTYDGLQPTGMMARDRAPRLSRFNQLVESLQNMGS